jgi:hypothetical protein
MEAQEPRATRLLRVAVIATDAVRRADLVAIVTGAGHEIVDTVDRADVVSYLALARALGPCKCQDEAGRNVICHRRGNRASGTRRIDAR